MTDRERILVHITQRTLLYRDHIVSSFTRKKEIKKGNIVVAMTTILPNQFLVGYYQGFDKEKGCIIIKDLVSKKLCNYYNESFIELPLEWFSSYELLYGKKYKIYITICKAIKGLYYRFNELDFNDIDNNFTFSVRKPFTDKAIDKITLSQDLNLKEIKKEIENWEIKDND